MKAADTKDIECMLSGVEGDDEGGGRVSGLVCRLEHFPVRSQSADCTGTKKNKIKLSLNPISVSLCNSFLLHSLFIPEQIWRNLEGSIFQMAPQPPKNQQKSEPETVSQFGFRNRAGTMSVEKKTGSSRRLKYSSGKP